MTNKEEKKNRHLNSPGSHVELFGKFLPYSLRRLLVDLECVLQGTELSASSAFAMFDLVRDVRGEIAEVNFMWVRAGREDARDV